MWNPPQRKPSSRLVPWSQILEANPDSTRKIVAMIIVKPRCRRLTNDFMVYKYHTLLPRQVTLPLTTTNTKQQHLSFAPPLYSPLHSFGEVLKHGFRANCATRPTEPSAVLDMEPQPVEEYAPHCLKFAQDILRGTDMPRIIARFLLNFKGIDYKTEWVSVFCGDRYWRSTGC